MGKLHNVTSGILSKVREYNLPYYKMVTNLTFYAIIKGGIVIILILPPIFFIAVV